MQLPWDGCKKSIIILLCLFSFRAAKRNTDEKSFYGGILHVCYAPEYETVEDIRKKLHDRRSYVNRACIKSGSMMKY